MKKIFLLLSAFLFPAFLFAGTVTVYHTSDVHGFFYPRNGRGGFGALAAVINKGPDNYLLLDSGDFANGTVETRNSKGLKAVRLMTKLGYHAATVGNHEFDFKDKGVAPILNEAKFPILAANFYDKSTGKYPTNVTPYKIFDVDGVKVAVIGLANREPTNPAKSYSYGKPLKALEKALKEVETQKADVVLLAEIYAARERNTIGISSRDLQAQIPGSVYCETLPEVTACLKQIARPGDVILTIGAGDIYRAGEALLK